MRPLDFSPLYRTAVGFDNLMSVLDEARKGPASDGYPPHNIEKLDSDSYRVTVAVAGFTADDIEVEVRDSHLVISGGGAKDDGEAAQERTYLHRGIARRAFELRFQLADHVVVKGADLRDGLLEIGLEREIPEALKPRRIPIGGGSPKVIDSKAAA